MGGLRDGPIRLHVALCWPLCGDVSPGCPSGANGAAQRTPIVKDPGPPDSSVPGWSHQHTLVLTKEPRQAIWGKFKHGCKRGQGDFFFAADLVATSQEAPARSTRDVKPADKHTCHESLVFIWR